MLVYDVLIFYYFSIYWSDTSLWVSLQCVTVAFIGHTHFICVLFCCVVLCVLSRLPITSLEKREVDAY